VNRIRNNKEAGGTLPAIANTLKSGTVYIFFLHTHNKTVAGKVALPGWEQA
jgi:hypothetical protein